MVQWVWTGACRERQQFPQPPRSRRHARAGLVGFEPSHLGEPALSEAFEPLPVRRMGADS